MGLIRSKQTNLTPIDDDLLIDYLLRLIIGKASLLKDEDFNDYVKALRKRKIYKLFPNKTKKDKLRRIVIKFYLRKYIKKNI